MDETMLEVSREPGTNWRHLARPTAIVVGLVTAIATLWCIWFRPSWVPYPAVLGPLLVYFVFGAAEHRPNDTPEGFFLFDRKMPTKYFVWTFVATNLGLFSSVAYTALLAYVFGFAAMLWATLAWFVGMFWFSRRIPQLLPFFRRGHTLHQFISESYGHTERQRIQLRILTSVVTGTLFWASIAIEVKFGAIVFQPILGFGSAATLAVIIALVGICYSYLAGYRGAVQTDYLQGWVMAIGSVGILIGCGILVLSDWKGLPAEFCRPSFALLGPDRFSLLSQIVLVLPYQFCVMDMWQRCIAVAQSNFGASTESPPDDQQVIGQLRNLVFWRAILPFLWLFIVWYAMGWTALGTNLTTDPGNIIPAFLSSLQTRGWAGATTQALAIIVFVSALISTLDTFTVALTQSFMCDIYTAFRSQYRSIATGQADDSTKYRFIFASRFFIVAFGLSATIVAFVEVGLLNFWVGMYSLMLAFFPPVYVQLLPSTSRLRQRVGFHGAFWGVLIGFIAALALGITGTFLTDNSVLVSAAPFASLSLSAVVMVLMPRRRGHA